MHPPRNLDHSRQYLGVFPNKTNKTLQTFILVYRLSWIFGTTSYIIDHIMYRRKIFEQYLWLLSVVRWFWSIDYFILLEMIMFFIIREMGCFILYMFVVCEKHVIQIGGWPLHVSSYEVCKTFDSIICVRALKLKSGQF